MSHIFIIWKEQESGEVFKLRNGSWGRDLKKVLPWECGDKIPDRFEGGESQDIFANEGRKIRGKEKSQRGRHISVGLDSCAVSLIELAKKNENKRYVTLSLTSFKKRKIHLTFLYSVFSSAKCMVITASFSKTVVWIKLEVSWTSQNTWSFHISKK